MVSFECLGFLFQFFEPAYHLLLRIIAANLNRVKVEDALQDLNVLADLLFGVIVYEGW